MNNKSSKNKPKINDDPMDYETQMNKIIMPSMVFMLIVMGIAFSILSLSQNQLMTGNLTSDQYLDRFKVIAICLGVSMAGPFILMGIMSIKIRLDRANFQALQAILDTFEVVISKTPYDCGLYQIQTPAETSPSLRITKKMLRNIRNTKSYQNLLKARREGKSIVDLDSADLYAQINQDPLLSNGLFIEQLREAFGIEEGEEIRIEGGLSTYGKEENNEHSDMFEEPESSKEDEFDFDFEKEFLGKDEKDSIKPSEQVQVEEPQEDQEDSQEDQEEVDPFLLDDNIIGEDDSQENEEPLDLDSQGDSKTATLKSLLPKSFLDKLRKKEKEDADNNEFMPIRNEDKKSKAEVIKINYDVLAQAEYLSGLEGKWQLGFRNVTSIRSIDDPHFQQEEWDDKLEQWIFTDPILNADSICYLIPDDEKKVFRFHERMSNDGNFISVRKCYAHWSFVGWLIDNRIPLFIHLGTPQHNNIYNIKLSSATFHDAETTAHTQLTHMAYLENENLHKTILGLKADKQSLLTEIAKVRQEKIQKWLDSVISPGEDFKRRITMKPLNVTSWVFGIVMLLLGILGGWQIYSLIMDNSPVPAIGG